MFRAVVADSEVTFVFAQSAVTKNVSEKSINNILEYVAGEGKVNPLE